MQFSLLRPILVWFWRILSLVLVGLWIQQSAIPTYNRTDQQRDIILYFRAAQNVNAGRTLYTARPNYGPDSKPFEYLYPPPFAAAIAPLGRLTWLSFSKIWTLGLIASFLGFALCLSLLSKRLGVWNFIGWLAIICVFPGASRALSLGQIDPFLWFLSALGLWVIALPYNQPRALSGAVLGLASLIKIYAVWPLFSVGKSEGRAQIWGGAVVVGALGLALGAIVCGFDSYTQWARAVLPIAGQGTFNPDNYSLSMGILRVAGLLGWNYTGGPLVGLPKLWLSLAAIAGPLTALILTRHRNLRWRVALITVAAAWCAPLCWSTYLPLSLVLVALSAEKLRHERVRATTEIEVAT